MTTPVQFGTIATLVVTMKNYGVTDIPSNLGVLFDLSHVQTGGDNPPGCVLPTATAGVAATAGVTQETIKAGGVGRVIFNGTVPMTSDGTITAGGYVQVSDTSLKLGYAKARGALGVTVEQLGQAITSSTDGQPVLVFLSKAATA